MKHNTKTLTLKSFFAKSVRLEKVKKIIHNQLTSLSQTVKNLKEFFINSYKLAAVLLLLTCWVYHPAEGSFLDIAIYLLVPVSLVSFFIIGNKKMSGQLSLATLTIIVSGFLSAIVVFAHYPNVFLSIGGIIDFSLTTLFTIFVLVGLFFGIKQIARDKKISLFYLLVFVLVEIAAVLAVMYVIKSGFSLPLIREQLNNECLPAWYHLILFVCAGFIVLSFVACFIQICYKTRIKL